MKKIIRKAAFVAAFALTAGYGVYSSQEAVELSELALANVEALANFEGGSDVYCCGNYGDCMLILGGGTVKGIKFFTPCQ